MRTPSWSGPTQTRSGCRSASTSCSSGWDAAAWPRCGRPRRSDRWATRASSWSSASCPSSRSDDEFVRMFVEEARLSASLNHRNIVQVYEFGEAGGEFYLAMEWVHGRDLNSLLRALKERDAEPPIGLAAYVAREVCRALAYAHALTDERGPAAPAHPPRRVAVERHARLRRQRQAARLRHRQGAGAGVGEPHAGRRAQGQVRLHGARAGRRRERARPSRRPVRRRRGAVGDADVAAAVQGRQRRADDRPGARGPGAAAVGVQPGGAARARSHLHARAGAGAQGALRRLRRAGGGARRAGASHEVRRRRRGAADAARVPRRARADPAAGAGGGGDLGERTPSRPATPTPAGERVANVPTAVARSCSAPTRLRKAVAGLAAPTLRAWRRRERRRIIVIAAAATLAAAGAIAWRGPAPAAVAPAVAASGGALAAPRPEAPAMAASVPDRRRRARRRRGCRRRCTSGSRPGRPAPRSRSKARPTARHDAADARGCRAAAPCAA